MTLPVVLRRAASAELEDAADWYEQQSAGLGNRFTNAVEEVFDRIGQWPDFYAVVYKDVREALVPGFPYCVYYQAEPTRIVVLSVFHTARDPAVWQGRA